MTHTKGRVYSVKTPAWNDGIAAQHGNWPPRPPPGVYFSLILSSIRSLTSDHLHRSCMYSTTRMQMCMVIMLGPKTPFVFGRTISE